MRDSLPPEKKSDYARIKGGSWDLSLLKQVKASVCDGHTEYYVSEKFTSPSV